MRDVQAMARKQRLSGDDAWKERWVEGWAERMALRAERTTPKRSRRSQRKDAETTVKRPSVSNDKVFFWAIRELFNEGARKDPACLKAAQEAFEKVDHISDAFEMAIEAAIPDPDIRAFYMKMVHDFVEWVEEDAVETYLADFDWEKMKKRTARRWNR